jgi:hypothetical protein
MAYFIISITLLLAGLVGGLMISRRPRRIWAPVCSAIAIVVALLGVGLHREEYDAYFVYLVFALSAQKPIDKLSGSLHRIGWE